MATVTFRNGEINVPPLKKYQFKKIFKNFEGFFIDKTWKVNFSYPVGIENLRTALMTITSLKSEKGFLKFSILSPAKFTSHLFSNDLEDHCEIGIVSQRVTSRGLESAIDTQPEAISLYTLNKLQYILYLNLQLKTELSLNLQSNRRFTL